MNALVHLSTGWLMEAAFHLLLQHTRLLTDSLSCSCLSVASQIQQRRRQPYILKSVGACLSVAWAPPGLRNIGCGQINLLARGAIGTWYRLTGVERKISILEILGLCTNDVFFLRQHHVSAQ